MESIYWVISKDCNCRCRHCYNDSEPGAAGLTLEQVHRCVERLPGPEDVPLDRVIISGGEPLVWPELLFPALEGLYQRYGEAVELHLQTNGDLLDEPVLARLLAAHVVRIDVASQDRYHPKVSRDRRSLLEGLFRQHGMRPPGEAPRGSGASCYAFWGSTEDNWIGPLWPRGRALRDGLSRATPEDRFCAGWSGAVRFVEYRDMGSEVNIQLADVYPCCPMTVRPLGSVLHEPLLTILDRCAGEPVLQALNRGRPEAMGEHLGLSEEYGFRRSRELGNHCLWCDEFFTRHAPELLPL
jgi:hypothetical protein